MKIFWSYASVAELAALPVGERKRVWELARRVRRSELRKCFGLAVFRTKAIWAVSLIGGTLGGLSITVGEIFLVRALGIAIAFLGTAFLDYQFQIRSTIPYVRRILAAENGENGRPADRP